MLSTQQFGSFGERALSQRRYSGGLFNGRSPSDRGIGTGRSLSDRGIGTGRSEADSTSFWADFGDDGADLWNRVV